MKAKLTLLILAVILAGSQLFAQQPTMVLTVFEPLPKVDLTAFLFSNDLKGSPRLMTIDIQPTGTMVRMRGNFEWQRAGENNYNRVYTFKTGAFSARSFSNQEIGTQDIRIEEEESVSSLIDENLRKGRPTGKYKIFLELLDQAGNPYSPPVIQEKELEFVNPTQTLSIIAPIEFFRYDMGNVTATWTEAIGATRYLVRAAKRLNPSQSPEEILSSSTPLIDNVDVGNVTSVNLRNILQREWNAGDEIAIQITAVVSGPGGGEQLQSNIVRFFIEAAGSNPAAGINSLIAGLLQYFPSGALPSELIRRISEGSIQITGFTDPDGNLIPMSEVTAILNYLSANPGALSNLYFIER